MTRQPEAFPARLRRLREAAGLTVPALADLAGISRAQVHNYESGRQEPKLSTLISLARALGVSLDALGGK